MNGYIGLWTITTLESSRAPGPGTSPRSPGHIMASMVACFCASSLSFACLSCASQHQSTVKIGQRCHAGFNCQTRKGFWFLGCILFSGMNQQELCQKTEKKGKCKICKQKYESSLEMPFHIFSLPEKRGSTQRFFKNTVQFQRQITSRIYLGDAFQLDTQNMDL